MAGTAKPQASEGVKESNTGVLVGFVWSSPLFRARIAFDSAARVVARSFGPPEQSWPV